MAAPPVFAFVITGHGYGHASRQMEVIRVLGARHPDARFALLSAAPGSIFHDYLGAQPGGLMERIELVPYRADIGIVQLDGLVMDRAATLDALERLWADPARAEDDLAARLRPYGPSLVVSDVPPVAFGAAAKLGVPSVAVASFDWATIYAHYARTEPAFDRWVRCCLAWQSQATAAVHLEPGPPLAGFARVVEVPPVARRPLLDARAARAHLAIAEGHRAVLASFGGFGLSDADRRIPPLPGVTWLLAPPMPKLGRADTRWVDDLPYLSLLASADAVFTKPGYGIVCEAAENRTRILYTDRGDFPEYPWLVRWMTDHVPASHVASSDLGDPSILAAALARLFVLPDPWAPPAAGAELTADVLDSLSPTR